MAIAIEDFPMKNGDFPWQNVSSPEGKWGDLLVLKTDSHGHNWRDGHLIRPEFLLSIRKENPLNSRYGMIHPA